MIRHFSIAAEKPQHVAGVIAELWQGEAFPFPPVGQGSWVAFAGDDRGTSIEVYPLGSELAPAEGDVDSFAQINPEAPAHTATHAAIDTPLTETEVDAIAAREGWITKYRKRGGKFGVIEFWLENRVMLEVLTAEMQAEYLAVATPATWRAMLAAGGPPRQG